MAAQRPQHREAATGTPRLSVALITPPGDADSAMTDSVRRVLDGASIAIVENGAADAVLLVGGLRSRCFLDDDKPGAIRPDIVDAVRHAFAAKRWIAAPGVAVAAALSALDREVAAGRATQHRREEGVAIFPDLRLICLERPMLSEIDGARDAAIAQLVQHLVAEAAA